MVPSNQHQLAQQQVLLNLWSVSAVYGSPPLAALGMAESFKKVCNLQKKKKKKARGNTQTPGLQINV